jgi:ATPase complex subunit ATP10
VKEATRGYFHDLNATRKYGGKTWIAPSKMIRQEVSIFGAVWIMSPCSDSCFVGCPLLPGYLRENACQGESRSYHPPVPEEDICNIDALNQNIGGEPEIYLSKSPSLRLAHSFQVQTASLVNPTNEVFLSNPNYRFVQINLQENLLKSLLVSMFLSSLRQTIPVELQPTYLVSSQNMEYVRDSLGMVNKHIGYVYLLDEYLKVRWAACGDGKPEEADALRTSVGVLLNRLEKSAKS